MGRPSRLPSALIRVPPQVIASEEHPRLFGLTRAGIFALGVFVEFGVKFIPYVGWVFNQGYQWVVERPVWAMELWDARGQFVLEQARDAGRDAGQDEWAHRIVEIVGAQRQSPFEISPSAVEDLTRRRWEFLDKKS